MRKKKDEKLCTVFIPKLYKHDDAQYVAVNGRRMLVKKGEAVQLPPEFAELIKNSESARLSAMAYIDSVSAGE